jgi:hypothetical protein
MKLDALASVPSWAYGASGAVLFKTADEFAAANADADWYDTPAEVPAEVPALDRAALLEQAEAKGLKADKRWSDKRLADELAKV